ncbi:MAG: FMN-binding negative transcriptional regulator [Chloroflexota bacterium]
MYQPGHGKFKVDDPTDLLGRLSAIFPATLVSHGEDGFWTSILPMLFYPEPGETDAPGILHGHLARGNPHWRVLQADGHVVAIFNGNDAYISPSFYEEKRLTGKVVPTWNYLTVVVHGIVTTHHEPEWLLPHVRRLVERHEAGRADPWSLDDAPAGYPETQVKAIVGLEMRIERIEAKRKLSQNRSEEDIAGTIAGLSEGAVRDQAVADDMTSAGLTTRRRDATHS